MRALSSKVLASSVWLLAATGAAAAAGDLSPLGLEDASASGGTVTLFSSLDEAGVFVQQLGVALGGYGSVSALEDAIIANFPDIPIAKSDFNTTTSAVLNTDWIWAVNLNFNSPPNKIQYSYNTPADTPVAGTLNVPSPVAGSGLLAALLLSVGFAWRRRTAEAF